MEGRGIHLHKGGRRSKRTAATATVESFRNKVATRGERASLLVRSFVRQFGWPHEGTTLLELKGISSAVQIGGTKSACRKYRVSLSHMVKESLLLKLIVIRVAG